MLYGFNYQKCHIHSLSQGESGAITAQRRMSPSENTGFIFINCRVTGSGQTVLGRPWGPYSRVIFAWTYLSAAVLPQGWNDWGKPNTRKYICNISNYIFLILVLIIYTYDFNELFLVLKDCGVWAV